MEHYTEKTFSTTHSIGFMLTKARKFVAADIDAGVTPHEITCQKMRHVRWLSSGIAAASLQKSKHCDIDDALMTRMLERLGAKGLLKRFRSSTDRRVVDLKVTLRLLGKFIDTNTHR